MAWLLLLVALVVGCPAPHRYAVDRPGLECDRATRVARRALMELGYTITDLVPAGERTGWVSGVKTLPDGGKTTGRVRIKCTAQGAVVQPIEDSVVPTYDFSRGFDYSYRALVQMPDTNEPRAARGLEVQVHPLDPHEALLDLGGVPVQPGALAVRVTVRNNTDRAVALDPARLALVPATGNSVMPLAGAELNAALAPGKAGDNVRAEQMKSRRIAPHATATGYLVYPAGSYREAQVSIEDVETQETEGFVTPLE
jgi:hypothetical protein